ncbi:MAG: LemA family protein [Marinifilaceae bacterium]
MANELDELNGPVNEKGNDVNVIQKQLPITVGIESTLFEIGIWVVGFLLSFVLFLAYNNVFVWLLSIVLGCIYIFAKIKARNYLFQLQQDIQSKASSIDNYLEQRVVILQNVVGIVNKAIDLDKDVMKSVAAFRGGMSPDGNNRNQFASNLEATFNTLVPHIEAYPELKAHASIADAMRQNSYLQKEITAARELYNDTVLRWNTVIYEWPVKKIVAARAGYTTKIPFSASNTIKEQARGVFF